MTVIHGENKIISFSYISCTYRLNLTIWNLTVDGLSQFVTKEADYSLRNSRLTINISIPYIMLTTMYDLDSSIDLGDYPYPLHGAGHMK